MNVIIERDVFQKIMHWVDKAGAKEVSGFGKIVLVGETWIVKTAYMMKQKNSGADTELQASDVAKAMYLHRNDEGMMNWWWHSHHSMGVFWSPTDHTAIKELSEYGFILATVFNNKREVKTAFRRQGDDVYPPVFIDDIDTKVRAEQISAETIAAWDKEYTDNVIIEPPVTTVLKDYTNHNGSKILYDSAASRGRHGHAHRNFGTAASAWGKTDDYQTDMFLGYEGDDDYYGMAEHYANKANQAARKDKGIAEPVRHPNSPTGYPAITKEMLFGRDLEEVPFGGERYWWRKFYDEYTCYPMDADMLDQFYLMVKNGQQYPAEQEVV